MYFIDFIWGGGNDTVLLTAAWAQLIHLLRTHRVSQWGWLDSVMSEAERGKTEGGLSEQHSSVGEAKHNTVPSSISLCAASVSRCELAQLSLWEPVLKSCSPCEGGHVVQSLFLDRPLKGGLRVGIRVRIRFRMPSKRWLYKLKNCT